MEFEDALIYITFRKELRNYIGGPYRGIKESRYERFIDSLDLGIKWKRVLEIVLPICDQVWYSL